MKRDESRSARRRFASLRSAGAAAKPRRRGVLLAGLVWKCDACGTPIADGEGWLTIRYDEINDYRRAEAEWHTHHPVGNVFSFADLIDLAWHTWHKSCDPDIDSRPTTASTSNGSPPSRNRSSGAPA